MEETVLVIVQCRVESTRFPGKVLAPLLGQPLPRGLAEADAESP
jgi:spore coat polysaccharide biosynthesis protein SpsF (cytidylyltransferase family)